MTGISVANHLPQEGCSSHPILGVANNTQTACEKKQFLSSIIDSTALYNLIKN